MKASHIAQVGVAFLSAASLTEILIVEDDVVIAADLRDCLERFGYTVAATVPSGDAALEQIAARQPDLVIMDIKLKGRLDGVETAQLIRDEFALPVIFLSAYSDTETVERAKITEPFGFLTKPFEERDLRLAIELAIHKNHVEVALRTSQHWYETTLRSIGDGIIATDEDGLVRFMNPVAESITGWLENDARGRPLVHVYRLLTEAGRHLDDFSALLRTTAAEEPEPVRYVLESRTGSHQLIDQTGSTIVDAHGSTKGLVVTFRSISTQCAAPYQRSRWRQFEEMVGRTDEIHYTYDLRRGQFDSISPAVEHVFGYTPIELLALDAEAIASFVHPDDRARIETLFEKLSSKDTPSTFLTQGPLVYEYRVRDKNGRYHWCSNRFLPLLPPNGGQIQWLAGTIRDISAEHEARTGRDEAASR